jgi:Domain of unknown function (DUF6398)
VFNPSERLDKMTMDNKADSPSVPTEFKPEFETMIGMIETFCREYLNEEYAGLCRTLAAALALKCPSLLIQESLNTWACGIIRTIGWVNFLNDQNHTPHLNPSLIDEAFGVATSTGQGKSKEIREMFNIRHFEPRWTLPSQMDDNPRVPNNSNGSPPKCPRATL